MSGTKATAMMSSRSPTIKRICTFLNKGRRLFFSYLRCITLALTLHSTVPLITRVLFHDCLRLSIRYCSVINMARFSTRGSRDLQFAIAGLRSTPTRNGPIRMAFHPAWTA